MILYRNAWATARVVIRKDSPKVFGSAAAVVNETLASIKEKEGSGEYYQAEVYESGDEPVRAGWAKGVFFKNGPYRPYFIYATLKGDYSIKLCFGCNRLNVDAIEKSVGEFQRLVDEGKTKL